eukprot:CAMPEP_0170351046 /NCGR_PEP_ID=MMETSP0116_2-20130129/76821_1 /TAXON_ID=400756 /ORGANISM="Durinskia baltica, Strain CSIRO CS-38" /LENGTH=114 /DNA_ID=CAMNT_0010604945 /DNA_START=95 /DNA_END=436 /DNA_ORIENTATION=+
MARSTARCHLSHRAHAGYFESAAQSWATIVPVGLNDLNIIGAGCMEHSPLRCIPGTEPAAMRTPAVGAAIAGTAEKDGCIPCATATVWAGAVGATTENLNEPWIAPGDTARPGA